MPIGKGRIQGAVDLIKAGAKIPGAKPPAASPAAGGNVDPAVRATPASQAAGAAAVIAEPQPAVAGAPEEGAAGNTPDDIVALTQRALDESKARNKVLEDSNLGLVERLAEVVGSMPKPGEKPVEEKPLPDGYDDMSVEDKIEVQVARRLDKEMDERFATHDDKLRKTIGPVLQRALDQGAAAEKKEISEEHPNFNWDGHADELAKLHKEVPNLSMLEMVKIVADPAELVKPVRQPPNTLASVPSSSTAAASGRPNSPQHTSRRTEAEVSVDMEDRLVTASTDARRRGSRVESDKLMEAGLRERLFGQGGLRKPQ